MTLLAADATPIPVNIAMRRQRTAGTPSIAIVVTDLTQWQRVEEGRERAIRSLRIMNACNDAMIHATDETAMMVAICEAMVDIGGHKLAWIGYLQDDPPDSVRLVARAGGSGEYGDAPLRGPVMAAADATVAPAPCGTAGGVCVALTDPGADGCGCGAGVCDADETTIIACSGRSIGAAIRARRVIVTRDRDIEPDDAGWRCLCQDAGCRASATAPLFAANDVRGGLVICTEDPDAFRREEWDC